ncbi:MAG: carboxypeptidase-like regulatory domain-containing protein [Candidatus Vogelbacteria bacterium]|nr:carboxypeptidase-like regulatory domain-containing protein [Candidatus Vogelbacteria bacterium]
MASETEGTIDASNKHAWSENVGWVDFGTTEGNVHVTDSVLTGYAWGENVGWISLNCSNDTSCGTVDYKVVNDSNGNLSGQAWSENVGWIIFNPSGGGVSINSAGEFQGTAWGETTGWIVFNCAENSSCSVVSYKVKTDWRPVSARGTTPGATPDSSTNTSSSHSYGSIISNWARLLGLNQPKIGSSTILYPELLAVNPLVEKITKNPLAEKVREIVKIVVPDFVQNTLSGGEPVVPSLRDLLPKKAPLSLRGKWNIMPTEASKFALAPLPTETRLLAQKFPELGKTFAKVGINRMADVGKLAATSLELPGLSTVLGLAETKQVNDRLLTVGIPIDRLSGTAKQKLPSDIVFVRSFGETLDINTNLTFDNLGHAKQQINVTTGKSLSLVVKPEAPVRGVKGYIVLTNQPDKTAMRLPMSSLMASAIFAVPKLAYDQEQPITKDTKFVLSSFEYTDPDHDGIYTAEVQAPQVAGQYEVITVMDYLNPKMGAKEIRLIAVVDPEGYVYTKTGSLEANVPGATVSLFWLNQKSGQFELWPAKEYMQKNPQQTNVRGNYSFLVPEGKYYLAVGASGYKPYQGEQYDVAEGNSIHANNELVSTGWGWIEW